MKTGDRNIAKVTGRSKNPLMPKKINSFTCIIVWGRALYPVPSLVNKMYVGK
jgi:hypothetical protein